MADKVQVDTKELDKIIRLFGMKMPITRVGIIGNNTRKGTGPSNADIGAAHEFGSTKVPKRSWLLMPLTSKLQGEVEKSKDLDESSLKEAVKEGSLVRWFKTLGILGEKIIQEAFRTGGFGKWKQWSKGYSNRTGQILVDTQQLRNSVTSDVKNG